MPSEAIVLFSGGSDSTLAAALMAEQHDKVHLLTFDRLSFLGASSYTKDNFENLKSIYGQERIVHKVLKIDAVHSFLCYQNYFSMVREFRTAVTAMTFSKLAMHLCAADYALGKNVNIVVDGATPYMEHYPDQNKNIALSQLKDFYSLFSIAYDNPVFGIAEDVEQKLYDKGLTKHPQVRGTQKDKQVYYLEQVLFAFYIKYFITVHGKDLYVNRLADLYSNRLRLMQEVLFQKKRREPTCLDKVREVCV